jgi:hypothetical protein
MSAPLKSAPDLEPSTLVTSALESPHKRKHRLEREKAQHEAELRRRELEANQAGNEPNCSDNETTSRAITELGEESMSSPPPCHCQLGKKTLPGHAAPPNLTTVARSVRAGHGKGKQPRNSRAQPDENTIDMSIPCPCTLPPRLQDTRADFWNPGR